MKASLGRIVHVQGPSNPDPIAAIVVRAHDDGSINAQLFGDYAGGYLYMRNVPHESATARDLVWRWPPRVE